jgi:hypothetical protein
MFFQFFGDPLLLGSQFLRGGVRKLASSGDIVRKAARQGAFLMMRLQNERGEPGGGSPVVSR